MLRGPSTLICTHHVRSSRRGRTDYPVCGRLWPHTLMVTQVRARRASSRGRIRINKCGRDSHSRFAITTLDCRGVDAHRTRGLDSHGDIPLWPPQNAHKWPVHAPRLGCTYVGGTFDIGLYPPRPLVASWTHALPGVWTSVATCFYGHPSTRTNGQCTRRGWDAQMLGGPQTLVCGHHACWSRRGRTHHGLRERRWPVSSLATPVRARMASARGAAGTHKC